MTTNTDTSVNILKLDILRKRLLDVIGHEPNCIEEFTEDKPISSDKVVGIIVVYEDGTRSWYWDD